MCDWFHIYKRNLNWTEESCNRSGCWIATNAPTVGRERTWKWMMACWRSFIGALRVRPWARQVLARFAVLFVPCASLLPTVVFRHSVPQVMAWIRSDTFGSRPDSVLVSEQLGVRVLRRRLDKLTLSLLPCSSAVVSKANWRACMAPSGSSFSALNGCFVGYLVSLKEVTIYGASALCGRRSLFSAL